jgi:hypothetical protein
LSESGYLEYNETLIRSILEEFLEPSIVIKVKEEDDKEKDIV